MLETIQLTRLIKQMKETKQMKQKLIRPIDAAIRSSHIRLFVILVPVYCF